MDELITMLIMVVTIGIALPFVKGKKQESVPSHEMAFFHNSKFCNAIVGQPFQADLA
jgi:hypothetical protein